MVWTNKGEYNGQFKKGEKHGYGVYVGTDGENYEGEWYNNLKQGIFQILIKDNKGKGKNQKDGITIHGEFYRNKPHGDVIMAFVSGERY